MFAPKRFHFFLARLAGLFCLGVAFNCAAHKSSDAFLKLNTQNERLEGQWQVALLDLERAVGLDVDQNGSITAGEVETRWATITDYARARLQFASRSNTMALQFEGEPLFERHSDGAYAVVRFSAPIGTTPVQVNYAALFDVDASHRGLVDLQIKEGASQQFVFSPANSTLDLSRPGASQARSSTAFIREGMHHIFAGTDHILFLLALLLPAVLIWSGDRWEVEQSLRTALWRVAKIVTAFTIAHSITLSLGALGILRPSPRWIEATIAFSVILAALNNLRPLWREPALLAFGFGLIHGFGFANVLGDLGLSGRGMIWPLLGFNVGVEAGQLLIVLAFVPIAFWIRHSAFYQRIVLRVGSVAISLVAVLWMVERLFDVRVFPA